jgi:hypothetical protein
MKLSTVPQVYADTILNGGGTFRHNGKSLTRGFAVAVVNDTFAIVDVNDKAAFEAAIIDLSAAYPNECIGTWVHEGRIYIDPSSVYTDESVAARDAFQRNQLAYYILHEQREVML